MRALRSRPERLLGAVLALMIGAMAMPSGVSAMTIGASAALRWWDCVHDWHWQGSLYALWGPTAQNEGTFDNCFYLYQIGTVDSLGRVQDGVATSDTYIVNQVVDWTTTYSDGGWTVDNYAKLTIKSSIAATGGAYIADPVTVSSNTCSPLSVGASLGGIGISVSEILCNGATLRRDSLNSSSVQWSGDNVVHMRRWDLAYMFKVGQGAKPTITARLYYPHYAPYKDGGQYCARGYCFPTWKFIRQWGTKTWIVTAP